MLWRAMCCLIKEVERLDRAVVSEVFHASHWDAIFPVLVRTKIVDQLAFRRMFDRRRRIGDLASVFPQTIFTLSGTAIQ